MASWIIFMLCFTVSGLVHGQAPGGVEFFVTSAFSSLPEPDRSLAASVNECTLKTYSAQMQNSKEDMPAEIEASAKEGRNPTPDEYKVIQRWFKGKAKEAMRGCMKKLGVSASGQAQILSEYEKASQ